MYINVYSKQSRGDISFLEIVSYQFQINGNNEDFVLELKPTSFHKSHQVQEKNR